MHAKDLDSRGVQQQRRAGCRTHGTGLDGRGVQQQRPPPRQDLAVHAQHHHLVPQERNRRRGLVVHGDARPGLDERDLRQPALDGFGARRGLGPFAHASAVLRLAARRRGPSSFGGPMSSKSQARVKQESRHRTAPPTFGQRRSLRFRPRRRTVTNHESRITNHESRITNHSRPTSRLFACVWRVACSVWRS